MKPHLLIVALLTTLAHAKPFPPAPSLNELVAAAARDRKKLHAPLLCGKPAPSATSPVMQIVRAGGVAGAGSPHTALPLKDLPRHPLSRTPAEAVGLSSTLRTVTPHPTVASSDMVDLNTVVPLMFSKLSDLIAASPARSLPGIVPMSIDPFRLKVEFIWEKPHGQWMNQTLKDIETARKAGDVEAYNALTARYSAWAEKYLRRENPPNLDSLR